VIDPYTGFTDEQMRDPRYMCWVHWVETISCVHCMFDGEAEMFFPCTNCHPGATKENGPWTWGWRGQCIRCMPDFVPLKKTTT
jgi:hypothetical protein